MEPSDPHHGDLIDLITKARTVARKWSDLAFDRDAAFTQAERLVLDHLVFDGPATVPEIARSLGVTRQHIQMRADALVRKGLAQFSDNPKHKKSKRLEATLKGEREHALASANEARYLAAVLGHLSAAEIADAQRTLKKLSEALAK